MVEEIVHISWIKRLKDSIVGLIFGIFCILIAIYLLFWNEKNSLNIQQSLIEIEKKLIVVPSSNIDPAQDQKPIYITGLANTEDNLQDPLLNIEINAIELKRQVEMYQWQEEKTTETKEKLGGGAEQITHYQYHPIWSNRLIDSNSFKAATEHSNPNQMPISDLKTYAKQVFVGNFQLTTELIKKIGQPEALQLNQNNLESITKTINSKAQISNNSIYIGNNPEQPQIGDIKISSSAIYPQKVSIIGMQSSNTIIPYVSSFGESILLINNGELSARQMLVEEMSNNSLITWTLRGLSLALFTLGFYLLLNPLVALANVVPILGNVVTMGIFFISFMISLCFWGFLTSIAWLTIRPLYALSFLTIIALSVSYLVRRKSKKIAVLTPNNLKTP